MTLNINGQHVTGFPIDPSGYVLKKEIRLDRNDWTEVLKKGDTVLDLHIPAGGAMRWDAMTESLGRASGFFGKFHPADPFKALVVTTWFMDPRLAGMLPVDANPLKLQRSVYLYPTAPDPDSIWFVFLRWVTREPASNLPAGTILQRTLRDFLLNGGTWNGGGFFLLPEDMTKLAENTYRTRFESLRREFGLPRVPGGNR